MFTGHCYCGKASVELNCEPAAVVSNIFAIIPALFYDQFDILIQILTV